MDSVSTRHSNNQSLREEMDSQNNQISSSEFETQELQKNKLIVQDSIHKSLSFIASFDYDLVTRSQLRNSLQKYQNVRPEMHKTSFDIIDYVEREKDLINVLQLKGMIIAVKSKAEILPLKRAKQGQIVTAFQLCMKYWKDAHEFALQNSITYIISNQLIQVASGEEAKA